MDLIPRSLNQSLCKVQLPTRLCPRNFIELGVRECVIADLVPLRVSPLQDIRCPVGFIPDDEKRPRNLLLLEHVEDLWCPGLIGAIVKREDQFVFCSTDLVYVIGKRIGFIFFPM